MAFGVESYSRVILLPVFQSASLFAEVWISGNAGLVIINSRIPILVIDPYFGDGIDRPHIVNIRQIFYNLFL